METPKSFSEEVEAIKKKNFNHMSLEDMINESDSVKLARLLYLQRTQLNKTNRILNNVLWFFWISIIYLIASMIGLLSFL